MVSMPWSMKTSRTLKTRKRGNFAEKRVRNHWLAYMCVSNPTCWKCWKYYSTIHFSTWWCRFRNLGRYQVKYCPDSLYHLPKVWQSLLHQSVQLIEAKLQLLKIFSEQGLSWDGESLNRLDASKIEFSPWILRRESPKEVSERISMHHFHQDSKGLLLGHLQF